MLEDSGALHVRAVKLRDSLQRVKTTWSKLGPECFGIKTYKPVCVDVTMAPSTSMLWYRTTLVKRFGRWQLLHHNLLFVSDEFVSGSLTSALPDPASVQEVTTLGHARECTHAQLGLEVADEALELLGDTPDDGAQAPFEAPIAPEPADEDVVAGPDEKILGGTRIDSTSSLAVLKAACECLGISVHGSRAQLFKRLVQHLKQQELLASHSVKHSLSKELQCPVNQPGIPAEPTEEEVREHNTTHIPYKAWCELCIAHKGRQDKHHRESHTSSERSVVSFDFGYSDRGTDETLTMLCIHDRNTKMMYTVPTASKGGKSLPYWTAGFVDLSHGLDIKKFACAQTMSLQHFHCLRLAEKH
eukprot:s1468_g3.t1